MCIWVSTFSTTGKTNGNLANQLKHNFYKRWRHAIRHRGPPVKYASGPLPFIPALSGDGSVGNQQRQEITLSTCNCKMSNPPARPSLQVTKKTESQRFSTIAGFKPDGSPHLYRAIGVREGFYWEGGKNLPWK